MTPKRNNSEYYHSIDDESTKIWFEQFKTFNHLGGGGGGNSSTGGHPKTTQELPRSIT